MPSKYILKLNKININLIFITHHFNFSQNFLNLLSLYYKIISNFISLFIYILKLFSVH